MPEIKIILYLGFLVSLIFIQDINIYLVMFIPVSMLLCRLPFRSVRSGWIPISLFLLFTFVGNVMMRHGRIIFQIGSFVVTQEGLTVASVRTARVFFMIAGAKILTASTGTEELIGAFGKLLMPLERLGVPVSELFSTMGLAIKSIPKIKDQISETCSGEMHGGKIKGFWNRTRAVSLFLIPLFVKSMQTPEKFFEDDLSKKER